MFSHVLRYFFLLENAKVGICSIFKEKSTTKWILMHVLFYGFSSLCSTASSLSFLCFWHTVGTIWNIDLTILYVYVISDYWHFRMDNTVARAVRLTWWDPTFQMRCKMYIKYVVCTCKICLWWGQQQMSQQTKIGLHPAENIGTWIYFYIQLFSEECCIFWIFFTMLDHELGISFGSCPCA